MVLCDLISGSLNSKLSRNPFLKAFINSACSKSLASHLMGCLHWITDQENTVSLPWTIHAQSSLLIRLRWTTCHALCISAVFISVCLFCCLFSAAPVEQSEDILGLDIGESLLTVPVPFSTLALSDTPGKVVSLSISKSTLQITYPT